MSDLDTGEFRLRSSVLPTLPAGRYRAELGHTIDGVGAVEPVTRTFAVVAPQFALSATEVQSVFPPPNSEGSYGTRLAQIALMRRTLPWEREVTPNDAQRRPWLALVVLTDAEAALRPGRPVTEAVPSSLHAALGITETSGTCDHIETSPAVVARTFPRPDELALLCHVREVAVGDTELAGADADGQLAVVLCARVPRPLPSGEKLVYGAYLISLEHRLDVLPTATGTPVPGLGPVQVDPVGPKTLRFPVLARWRFTAAGHGDFGSIMGDLHVGGLGTAPGGCPAVAPSGHVAIAHRGRRGEEAAAWYRGPLTPREVVRRPAGHPLFAADQARAIATDGLEDLSYAAAFELGRLLAMSDPRFLAELLTWRRESMAAATVAATLPLVPGVTDLGIDPVAAGQQLTVAVLDRMATDLDATFGERIPRVDLPPGFASPDDLSDIAQGYGLDLATVKRIVRDALIDVAGPQLPPAPALESSFATLAANPALLGHLRAELRRHVRALAVTSGLDPDTDRFNPGFAPATIPDLYG
ncbi:hypothetical protein [Phytohabitans rumicis]|uniref:Uncharacterized protein n=1 Tax=Phytohabitans rumicis TaxID=1076125 RepID=A0A6V8KUQ4_9ACTN|nr:hypothetical protein [Phytohabitans rumicis]GFJ87170.1 hypothetical protein Prum_008120 [Phytohabitans rumicis]